MPCCLDDQGDNYCLDDQDDYHCLDDQGDNRVHDVDRNCCMDYQDNHREQHNDVDHNPVRGPGE